MLGQLKMTSDGKLRDKVEMSIQRLRSFEPPEGYYLAVSAGGKDSQVCYELCKMAGVKFDAHYAVTSVDPPEAIRHLRQYYPDVIWEHQYYDDDVPRHYYKDGRPKPVTMWSLIADHTLPPTRKVRYCCAKLKEPGGAGRIVVTGVRWAESANRAKTHGVVGFQGKPKGTRKLADELGAEYMLNKHDEVIMNDDNDANRRMVEQCYRTRKTMVNPIVDWTEADVWEFLNSRNLPHCSLYDEGFTRIGCIGCPLSGSKNMLRDFERWPKYKENYIRAFKRMIDNHPGEIKILDPNYDAKAKLFDDAPEKIGGQSVLQDTDGSAALVSVRMDANLLRLSSSSSCGIVTPDNFAGGGYEIAEAMLKRWMRICV
jgi:phosphoadenosine phosphosulfate reductase